MSNIESCYSKNVNALFRMTKDARISIEELSSRVDILQEKNTKNIIGSMTSIKSCERRTDILNEAIIRIHNTDE